ncbi:nuclear transport factor 2 family protein [Acidaminococcus sp. NSJ-142]|jgi:hypothetical protein|uniref:nuclear transport factor 2 family protein n=1 Tax=Acidaminococcus TaxID=904 RepID=UPI0018F52D67|nr:MULTISPECIES: nuclear transport factor 2 family protein [Acidaminococcus]MCD2436024.1 nuclear transport factor 2 family protein [Acidaminococcus hominis]MCH4097404.1 nuclear transport factor 2 family protein [Acidaminococcus provencensis]
MRKMTKLGAAAGLAALLVLFGQPAPMPAVEAAAVQAGATSNREATSVLADKLALKELVDTFSILADEKNGIAQEALFTKDAVVENYSDGKLMTSLTGRENIGKAFDDFLKTQDVVYHINGQQVVDIKGNTATGTSYCYVVLISTQNGRQVKRSGGTRYHDTYVKQDGKWLIKKRMADFVWTEYGDLPLTKQEG